MVINVNLVSLTVITLTFFKPFPVICEENVIELNDDNFSDITKAQDWSLVLFHRNWCTRSKKMLKELLKAAALTAKDSSSSMWAKLDCETNGRKTCEKFSVSQVPVLFLFKKGNYFKEFLDKPDYIGMIRFAKSETGPGYTLLDNENQKEVFFSGRESKLIGSFNSDKSALKKSFLGLIEEWKHQFDFGVARLPTGIDKEEIILLRPKHLENMLEPLSVPYAGSNDVNELENWIITNKHGLVGHRHKYNFKDFKEPLVVVYYELDYERDPKNTHYWRNRVLKVAKLYPEFSFAVSATKEFNKEVINFGYNFMRPSITPLVCAYIQNKRYPMKEDFSVENFAQYMENLKVGKIIAHMRSDDPPESNDGPVKTAVARNFDEIVNESERDSLIKFYAPWCTWCKRLAPVWEELGEAMRNEDVDIVKYNAETNEVPSDYEVNGYPTIFWAPKESKKTPAVYHGGKELKHFIKFIAQQATHELKSYDRSGQPKKNIVESKEEL